MIPRVVEVKIMIFHFLLVLEFVRGSNFGIISFPYKLLWLLNEYFNDFDHTLLCVTLT